MGNLADRYRRNQQSISAEDQGKLANARVGIVGCGGLGGYMAEELARIGVGHLLLIDGDRFDVTNLNRQILATEKNLGEWKVEAGKERIRIVNSETNVEIVQGWFREEDASKLFTGLNLVFDALDTITARFALERSCHTLGIPLVFASIGGWYGQLGLSFPGDFSIARLYGKSERGVETILGNPPFTPAVVASLAVAEGVKLLTDKPISLRHSWLMVDLLNMEFEQFRIVE